MNNKGILLYKNENIRTVIGELRRHDGIERRQLQTLSGLSFATVSGICNELVQRGIAEERAQEAPGAGAGRTPKVLRLRPMARFGLCVGLQNRGEVLMALKDVCGGEVFRHSWRYGDPAGVDAIIEHCHDVFRKELRARSIVEANVIGVGVAIPGVFDLRTRAVSECIIAEWDGVRLEERFARAFRLPCTVDNLLNLSVSQALTGEGAMQRHSNAVYLHVGEGLGAGIIVDGQLLRGAYGYAAEIGHLPFGDPALPCRCGNCGCAETELSVSGFLATYARRTGANSLSREDFAALLAAGDAAATGVVRDAGHIMAKCVTTLLTVFDPECLYIGCGIGGVYPLMADAVARRVANLSAHYTATPIVPDTAGSDAVPKGILEMLVQRWDPLEG